MNSLSKAASWVSRLASEPAVPFGKRLQRQFGMAKITRLCECGCNSFDVEIPASTQLEPLCEPGDGRRMFFEIAFETNSDIPVACLFFADERGYLAGIDIICGAVNHGPVPDNVSVGKVAYVA
jgi:hypothetical protein